MQPFDSKMSPTLRWYVRADKNTNKTIRQKTFCDSRCESWVMGMTLTFSFRFRFTERVDPP